MEVGWSGWLEGMVGGDGWRGWLEGMVRGMVGGMVGFIQFAHHRSGDYRLKVARTIPFFTQNELRPKSWT